MFGLMLSAPATASAGAQAHPSGCTYDVVDSKMTVARCSKSNGGHYRAQAMCKDTDTGELKFFEGDWRNNGSHSRAYCQGSTRTVSAGITTKAS